jgi:hypothetical protein
VTRHALAWTLWIIALDWRVPFIRPALLARDVQAAVDIAHLNHLIPQNDLLPIPRPGRHSHFSVRLALDNDRGLIAGREFFENFFLDVCDSPKRGDLSGAGIKPSMISLGQHSQIYGLHVELGALWT